MRLQAAIQGDLNALLQGELRALSVSRSGSLGDRAAERRGWTLQLIELAVHEDPFQRKGHRFTAVSRPQLSAPDCSFQKSHCIF